MKCYLRKTTVGLAAAVAIAMTTSAALAAETVKIRIAGYMPVKNYITEAMNRFKDSVEKGSGGSITVEHYPAATLFKTTNLHKAVSDGQIEMGYGTTAWFAGQLPAMGVMDLPFLFRTKDQVKNALLGDFGAGMSEVVEAANMKIIGWLDLGFTNALGVKKITIKKPDDLKGLRLRGFGVFPAMTIRELGGAATTISSKETYSALQRGVVDGAISIITSFHTRKWFEVVDNITVVPLGYVAFGVYANKDWWNKLSPAHKAVLTKATAEATASTFAHTTEATAKSLAAIKAAGKGVYVVPAAEYPVWQDKVKKVYTAYREKAGASGIKLLELAKKYNN